jgi:hypothetical protein
MNYKYSVIFFTIRNEFAYDSFKSIRSLALMAVALECNKAIFFGGIPQGQ